MIRIGVVLVMLLLILGTLELLVVRRAVRRRAPGMCVRSIHAHA